MVLSMDQIEIFNPFLNLKPFNCEQINFFKLTWIIRTTFQVLEPFNYVKVKLLILDSDGCNHITVYKQMSSGNQQTIRFQIKYI